MQPCERWIFGLSCNRVDSEEAKDLSVERSPPRDAAGMHRNSLTEHLCWVMLQQSQKYELKRVCDLAPLAWSNILSKPREQNRLIGFIKRKLRLRVDLDPAQERWGIRKHWEAEGLLHKLHLNGPSSIVFTNALLVLAPWAGLPCVQLLLNNYAVPLRWRSALSFIYLHKLQTDIKHKWVKRILLIRNLSLWRHVNTYTEQRFHGNSWSRKSNHMNFGPFSIS